MSLVLKYASPRILGKAKLIRQSRRLDLDNFEKRLFSKALPEVLPPHKLQPLSYLQGKLEELVKWYEDFSGLNEVRQAQDKVIEAGAGLEKAQKHRRLASVELLDIQRKLKELYAELDNTKRGDDRYIYLITEERKLLKEEEAHQEQFKDAERAEREMFNILSGSVQNSHQKERTYAEKTKYWSIIGSILGTVLGILGTSISNHIKMTRLQSLILESSNLEIKGQLKTYAENGESVNDSNLKDLLQKLDNRLNSVEGFVKKLESTGAASGIQRVAGQQSGDNSELLVQFDTLHQSIERDNKQMKILLVSASLICVLAPIIAKIAHFW